jgi:polar amino acid transport system substrate-binding protein
MFKRPRILALALVALTLLAGVTAACGDDDGDGAASPTAAPARTAASTPATGATQPAGGEIDISGVEELDDGTLDLGSDIAYAPIEFMDESNQPVGFDIDLANAMAEKLGVTAEFENAAFDGLIPALDAGRYDALFSAMTASDERKQQVDFVEYFVAGFGIAVASGNPLNIQGADDLCGKRVAVQEGTVQVDYLSGPEGTPGGLDQTCKDGGKEGITVSKFGTNPEAVLALSAGQADANVADYPVAAYSAQQSDGEIEVIELQIDPAPYGIAVRKTSTALRDALQAAFDAVRADGTYDEILEKWDLTAGELPAD